MLKPIKTNPELLALLAKAKDYKMTRAEMFEQRVSFVFGQLMECNPKISKEQVREHLMAEGGGTGC